MKYKYIFILFLLLLILFILFYSIRGNNINESFTIPSPFANKTNSNNFYNSPFKMLKLPFNSTTISLNNYTVIPYKLGIVNKETYDYEFGKLLAVLTPFDIVLIKNPPEVFKLIEKNSIQLGFVTEDHLALKTYEVSAKNKIFFVCGYNFVCFTLIVKLNSSITSWKNLKNKTIGTSNIYSNGYMHLKQIMKSLKYKSNEYSIVTGNIEEILEQFINSKIDAVYYDLVHPHPVIFLYEKYIKIRLIGSGGLNSGMLKFIIPELTLSTIYAQFYSESKNKTLNAYGVRNILIANQTVSNIFIYKFLYSLINNILSLKANRIYLYNLSPITITYTRIGIPIHPGALLFLENYNYLTNNDNPKCNYLYGKDKCTNKLIEKTKGSINSSIPTVNITSLDHNYIDFGDATAIAELKLSDQLIDNKLQ